ncbi:MAG: hypothetical protein M3R51_04500 [Candidatus Eremiobacteraeota bacterium]|nr:hypothetical protein [Candidatus Eremiobacteraeota bacterium]
MQQGPSVEYEARLRKILSDRDWQALREFSRAENQIPDDVYAKDADFWEILLHKLICSRIDMLAAHDSSRSWLSERGYSTDLGGY